MNSQSQKGCLYLDPHLCFELKGLIICFHDFLKYLQNLQFSSEKKLKLIFCLAIGTLISSCEDIIVKPADSNQNIEDFEAVWNRVNDVYPFLEFKKINWVHIDNKLDFNEIYISKLNSTTYFLMRTRLLTNLFLIESINLQNYLQQHKKY